MSAITRRGLIIFGIVVLIGAVFCYWLPFRLLPSIGLGVGLLQLILTQVVTFAASLVLPAMGDSQLDNSVFFALVLGMTFTTGAFLGGWIALKRQWLKVEARLLLRLVATSVGAYLPLVLGLIVYRVLEPGNPFFLVAELAAVVAFHLPSLIRNP